MNLPVLMRSAAARRLQIAPEPEDTVRYWLDRLGAQLDAQSALASHFEAYYAGRHPMMFATYKFRETFGNLFSAFADNWCQVVVDSSLERIAVQGFRFGGDENYEGDEEAWGLWQVNNLDADSITAHLEAIKTGQAFVIVDGGNPPLITVESPHEVTVIHRPGNRRQRAAALKRWLDEDRHAHTTLYLPEGSFRFVSARPIESDVEVEWEPDTLPHVPNAFGGVVPVIPLRNNPGMLDFGRSDLQPVIDSQNAINKLCTDMIVAAEYAAYPQRWATGVDIPPDPATGRRNPPDFLSDPARVWADENDNARFGTFTTSDLTIYVRAIEMFIQHIAAQTRTPPHYLSAGLGQWPSGDSLKASETGLVAKVRRKQQDFSDTWEEAMRLAFLALGDDERAAAIDAEVIWADPEYRTEGERVDALVKMRSLGVPLEALWSKWGATPQEIERWREMQAREVQLLGATALPETTNVEVSGEAATLTTE